jgi:hypothetical protein
LSRIFRYSKRVLEEIKKILVNFAPNLTKSNSRDKIFYRYQLLFQQQMNKAITELQMRMDVPTKAVRYCSEKLLLSSSDISS